MTVPGWVCPFCGTDCSPIEGPPCAHFFLADGEFGWRFTDDSRALYDAAYQRHPTLFRDLLYHDSACREKLVLRRAVYNTSLEIYVFSEDLPTTIGAFQLAIG